MARVPDINVRVVIHEDRTLLRKEMILLPTFHRDSDGRESVLLADVLALLATDPIGEEVPVP